MALLPYPDPDARARELADAVAGISRRRPGAALVEYGASLEGRPLVAVRVPRRDGASAAPRVLVCANTHGPEFIGNRVATAILDRVAADTLGPELRALLDAAELWVAPCLNPDGYARTWARGGRGELHELRPNHAGVDLNRNWPLPVGARRLPLPGTGSPTPGDSTYRGPAPLSEPETACLDALLEGQAVHASANLHSFMGTLFPPRVCRRADFVHYRQLCRAFRGAQRHRYLRLASRIFDTFTGEQEDHQHHTRRSWAVCVECFPLMASLRQNGLGRVPLFWRFNPRDPTPWIDNDVPAVAAFLRAALELERPAPR